MRRRRRRVLLVHTVREARPVHPYLSGAAPVAMAHRGAHGGGAGENSMEAFEHAVSLGYRYLETDVHRTADGVLVAMHDPTLDRTTDGEGEVGQRAWGEIARLRIAGGGRVPRLEELLDRWPDVRWNIDCKAAAATSDLVAVLRSRQALDRVCVGSFEAKVVGALRASLGDRLCSAASRPEVRRLVVAAALPRGARRAALLGLSCDVVQVPVEDGRTRIVTDRFVETCHDVGLPVHVWTVDAEHEMLGLLDLGVDGLITDESRLLRDVLTERGAWPPADGKPLTTADAARDGVPPRDAADDGDREA